MKFACIFLVLSPFVELIIASSVSSSTASPSALECQLDNFQNGFYKNYGNHNATHHLIPVGRFATVGCNPGYRLVGDERVECDADGHLRNQATCEDFNECSFVSDDDEGTDYSITSDNENADLINFPCIEPATCVNTQGSFTCHCRNKPIAQCTKFLPCTDLLSPEHGYIVEQSQIHVTFECNDGYSLKGSEIRRCVQGSWDGEQAQCQVTTCQPPQGIIANGWSDVKNRTYTYGEEVHYGCVNGFRLVEGNSWRICANNFWTSKTPSCTEIQCPDPGEILNGQSLLFSRDIGGEVHFRCNSGNFELLGSPVRVCQSSGKWSGTMTTCNNPATYCPTPVVPFNGMASVGSSLDHPFNFKARATLDRGDVTTFTCNYGYDLIGSKQRRCTATGQWSGEQAVCRAVGEYDDIEEVARRLVETTSLLRDGVQIQRRLTAESGIHGIDSNQHISNGSANAGSVKAGRLVTIPLSEPAGGDYRGLDVYFVFDVSKSIKVGKTLIEAIGFAKAFVNKVGVSTTGVGGTRYGAIAYASNAEVMFQLDGNSTDTVHKGLDAISNLTVSKHSLGEGTATSKALKLVHTNMIRHTASAPRLKGKRLNATKVLFLLTDGHSNMHGSPENEAAILKDNFDVAIHCIGIGNEVDRRELKKMASKPETEYVFLLKNFRTLNELTSAITVTAADYSECGISRGPKNTDEGVMTADDVWPWQAGLYIQITKEVPVFFCGGTLIAPNWILSAAHCFDPEENRKHTGRDVPENIIVYMGMNTRIKENIEVPRRAQMRKVKRIIPHEQYNSSLKPTYDNDIALLELQNPFILDAYVRTVCLPPTTKYESLLVPGEQNKPFATGWGKNNSGDPLSDHLKQIALPIRHSDDKFCRVTEHESLGHLTERMFCAGYANGRADTCNGDSGGPLVRQWRPRIENAPLAMVDGNSTELMRLKGQWYQVGIVSWGENCAEPGYYGYYTNLHSFVTWVENIIS